MLFAAPPMQRLLKQSCCTVARTSLCAYGARWRNFTKLAGWHAELAPLSRPLCRSHKESGQSWTSIASAYPVQFASGEAISLMESHDNCSEEKIYNTISA
eukprot:13631148-Heterocapsa_arctica.AAC.1